MNLNDFSDMGKDIKNIVQDAINHGDYSRLSQSISKTINQRFSSNKTQQGGFHYNPKDSHGNTVHTNPWKNTAYNRQTNHQPNNTFNQSSNSWNNATQYRRPYAGPGPDIIRPYGFPVKRQVPGSISGPILFISGLTIFSIFFIIEFIVLIVTLFSVFSSLFIYGLISFFCLLPFTVGAGAMTIIGKRKKDRVNRFHQYIFLTAQKAFCSIKDMAKTIKKSEAFVINDLEYMIAQRFFLEGHIDEQKTCFMASQEVYEQYLIAQNSMKEREKNQNTMNFSSKEKDSAQSQQEYNKILEDGNRYMNEIRLANDAIPDTEISNKLYRMEMIVGKIFEYVSKHPEQLSQLRRFTDYYMPTTMKLVNAYKEMDMQPIQGENIKKSKEEIAKSLDMINDAYEKLYDDMYVDVAMDVSSDIAVLQSLLASEGLKKSDF